MRAARRHTRWVIGLDEVGRGALAGPVTVAAAMLALDARGRIAHGPFRSLKDSKKLSAAQREFWAKELRGNAAVRFAIARVYPRRIERSNISAAANRAAQSAFLQLLKDHKIPLDTLVYLDGGLYLGGRARQRVLVADKSVNARTVIKADEQFPAVAAASIIAKVSRDAYMRRLAKKYPHYGFDIHKGYGTTAHLKALKKYGSCAAHRLTFLGKRPNMSR
jgi:ribonuclease HII